MIQVVGQGEGRGPDRVARVVRGLEAEVIHVERDLRLPTTAQVRDPEGLHGVFDRPVQPAEAAVAPKRRGSDYPKELFPHLPPTSSPPESVHTPSRDQNPTLPPAA